MQLKAGGTALAEVKIQRYIFQGDELYLLPLNHILRKCKEVKIYKITKKENPPNVQMYIKLFEKTKKETESLIQTIRI